MPIPSSILVVRPDRLGDVLLSTPVLGAIRAAKPGARIGFLARPAHAPLLRAHPWIDRLVEWDPLRPSGPAGALALGRLLRGDGWEAALVLQSDPWVTLGLRLAGIPLVAGPRSKPHSYLLFHRALRQRRSRASKHEAEYGLELLALLGLPAPRAFTPRVQIAEAVHEEAAYWLAAQGDAPRVAIHPGMGGSAANWEASRYVELAGRLASEGVRPLVTAGPTEGGLLAPFRQRVPGAAFFDAGTLGKGVDFLGALFGRMEAVVAPSTGPLHLAVSLGIPTVSVYPRKRVESPERWGPFDPEKRALHPVLLLGEGGEGEPTVERVFEAVTRLLARGRIG